MTHPANIVRWRKSHTLARWWNDLNCWRWPSEFGEPESQDVAGRPRRDAAMRAIEQEIFSRWRRGKLEPLKVKRLISN